MVELTTVSIKLAILFGGIVGVAFFILGLFGLAVFQHRYAQFTATTQTVYKSSDDDSIFDL